VSPSQRGSARFSERKNSLEEGREGDDAGVLFGPFLERISFVDREREGDDIGAPFTPSAHISSSSFLVYGPHLITKPSSSTIFGISPPCFW
jgi:hypothetical protein